MHQEPHKASVNGGFRTITRGKKGAKSSAIARLKERASASPGATCGKVLQLASAFVLLAACLIFSATVFGSIYWSDQIKTWGPDKWTAASTAALAILTFFLAIGGGWAAYESMIAAKDSNATLDLQRQAFDLEQKAALQLSCADVRPGSANAGPRPADNYLIDLNGVASEVVDGSQTFPTTDIENEPIDFPNVYPRCTLTNFGKLPILVPRPTIVFYTYEGVTFQGAGNGPGFSRPTEFKLVVPAPALQPGQSYYFGLLNGTSVSVKIRFPRTLSAYTITDGKTHDLDLAIDLGQLANSKKVR
jgi:hypothetical protein